jgi:23S rRNA (adenine2503-C2)-methyltransferase
MEPINLKAYTLPQLTELFKEWGHKPYRARQVYRWIYANGATDFEQMTDLSKTTRKLLQERAVLPQLTLQHESISEDGTRKYLYGLPDGETIESVWIPEERRSTLCISTQVGCAMGCGFCLTAQGGLTRNLESWEIVEQVLAARRSAPEFPPITNVVMMGMGEPLANLGNVVPALELLVDDLGIGLGPSKVTVSTVGVIPKIAELGRLAPYANLAVSLGASTDKVRNELIPVASKWPLKELMAACRNYPLPPRRQIFFEYILIKGVNDSKADAKQLVKLLHGVRCKVNLMSYNPSPGLAFERPEWDTVLAFQKTLSDSGIRTFVRKSRGQDVLAACGQLRKAEAQGDLQDNLIGVT